MNKMISKLMKWLKKEHPILLGLTIIATIVAITVVLIFTILGYRFAVNENARPDWEAIGSVFSFVSSIGAIGAAVFIPWQIAQKQNAIALFHKREEEFGFIKSYLFSWAGTCQRIVEAKDESVILGKCKSIVHMRTELGEFKKSEMLDDNNYYLQLLPRIAINDRKHLDTIKWLFTLTNEENLYIEDLQACCDRLIISMCHSLENQKIAKGLISQAKNFLEVLDIDKRITFLSELEKELSLS